MKAIFKMIFDVAMLSLSLSLQRSSGNGQFNMTLGTNWRQFDKVQDNRSVGKSDYFHFLPRLSYSNTTDRPYALNFADLTVFAVLVFLASVVKRVPIVIGQIFWFAKLTGKHVLSAHDFQTMGLVDSAF